MTGHGKAIVGVAAGVAVVIGLLVWLSASVSRLMFSIMPSPNAVSTSMELYTIELRSRHGPDGLIPDGKSPTEWILTVPRAFVVNEIGHPGVVRVGGREGTDYFVAIDAVFDEPARTLSPAALAQESEIQERFLGISIGNNGTWPEITAEDLCMKSDDFHALIEARGGRKAPADKLCTTTARCRIETHYKGWELTLHVTRRSKLYENPAAACALAKAFLSKHTIKVDQLN